MERICSNGSFCSPIINRFVSIKTRPRLPILHRLVSDTARLNVTMVAVSIIHDGEMNATIIGRCY